MRQDEGSTEHQRTQEGEYYQTGGQPTEPFGHPKKRKGILEYLARGACPHMEKPKFPQGKRLNTPEGAQKVAPEHPTGELRSIMKKEEAGKTKGHPGKTSNRHKKHGTLKIHSKHAKEQEAAPAQPRGPQDFATPPY